MKLVFLQEQECPNCRRPVRLHESDTGKIVLSDAVHSEAVVPAGKYQMLTVVHLLHQCGETPPEGKP